MRLFDDALSLKRGFYEGGKLRGANQDFKNANAPFEETASPDRDVMRARARWLHENNGIISGIDHAIKVNSIGNGLRFQSKTGIEKVDKSIEKKFMGWTNQRNCDVTGRQHFNDLQNLILGQRMTDGEILIHKKVTTDKQHPFKIQLFEADRFHSTTYGSTGSIDGIDLDANGKPQNYQLTKGLFDSVKVPADEIIHYLKMNNRSTQYRGLSEYKQVIIDLRNFAGYQSATIQALRSRSGIAYAIESPNVVGRINALAQDSKTNDPLYDINGVMVHYLNSGEKIHQFDPTISGTEYGEFVTSCVRMIATGRKISYELAFRDYTKTNFSSARASLIQDHKRFSEEQWHLATYVLNPLFEDWLDANVLAGTIEGLSAEKYFAHKTKYVQPRWIAPAREWVDPLKDIKAFKEEYALGSATLEEYAASRGKDLQEVIDQRAKENKMLKDAGILTQEEANAKKSA